MIDINFKGNIDIDKKILSVVVEADSFFYGIFSDKLNLCEVKYIDGFDKNNEDNWTPGEILPDGTFEKVNLSVINNNFMHFAEMPNLQELKELPIFINQQIFVDKFSDKEVYIAYGIENHIIEKFNGYFGDYDLHHFSTLISQIYMFKEGQILHAHFHKNYIHIYYQENNQFKFYNCYQCLNDKDFLYFIIASGVELGIDLSSITLYCSGLIDENSSLYRLINSYVGSIIFFDTFSTNLSIEDENLKKHYYLELMSATLCG
jgi:hypothetical protein